MRERAQCMKLWYMYCINWPPALRASTICANPKKKLRLCSARPLLSVRPQAQGQARCGGGRGRQLLRRRGRGRARRRRHGRRGQQQPLNLALLLRHRQHAHPGRRPQRVLRVCGRRPQSTDVALLLHPGGGGRRRRQREEEEEEKEEHRHLHGPQGRGHVLLQVSPGMLQ